MIGVLIVDDDFMVAKVHAGFVAALDGFEVVGTASTGTQALDEVTRLAPDLVLLDVYLPDMTGLEVLQRLRAGGSSVDVMVISAARDVDSIRSALHGGVLQYLVKPFDRATFEARLRDYASLRSELAELDVAGQGDVDRLFGGVDAEGHRAGDPGAGPYGPRRGGRRRALRHRVQHPHRPGAGERAAVPGAAGHPAAGRRPAALRDGGATRAPVHPARREPAGLTRRRNDRNAL
jgi:CheY-like chemotaxis protein